MAKPVDFSVVIEWDNARLSERERAVLMLRALGEQVGDFCRDTQRNTKPAVKIIFDPEEVEDGVIPTCLEEAGAAIENLDIEVIPAEKKSYYQQKNFGFQQTDAEVVVFLDSDVIPQENWLKSLLSSFDDPNVQVVCGNTYMTYGNMYERAFALFWFFNLRDQKAGLAPSNHFFANNVAFRREVFAARPFPKVESFRGQCRVLAQTLQKDGIKIYRNGAAFVEHPPPVSGSHFLWRALCDGHDEVVLSKAMNSPFYDRGLLGAGNRFARHMVRATSKIASRHRDVGLSPVTAVPALGIAAGYYGLKLVGELVTLVSPKPIRNHARL